MRAHEILALWVRQGYRPTAPWTGDIEAAQRWECAACGHIGLALRCVRRGDSLRCLAICPACGAGEEF